MEQLTGNFSKVLCRPRQPLPTVRGIYGSLPCCEIIACWQQGLPRTWDKLLVPIPYPHTRWLYTVRPVEWVIMSFSLLRVTHKDTVGSGCCKVWSQHHCVQPKWPRNLNVSMCLMRNERGVPSQPFMEALEPWVCMRILASWCLIYNLHNVSAYRLLKTMSSSSCL